MYIGHLPQVVLDAWAGKTFRQMTMNYSPCITRTRGKAGGFLLLKHGTKRWTSLQDLAKLQGSELAPPLDVSCVNAKQLGGMIGNAMSRNVLDRIIPRLLFAIGRLNARPVDKWATKS